MVGHHDAVHAFLRGAHRVPRIGDAFQHQLAFPVLAQPGDVLVGDGRIEVARHPGLKLHQTGTVRHGGRDIADDQRPAIQPDVPGPAGMKQDVEQPARPLDQALRSRQPADAVAVADAVDGQVHGQEQRVDARGFHPLEEIGHEAAVADHVELHPERALGRGAHFLDRTAGHGGQHDGDAGGFGRAHGLGLAPAAIEAGNADGR